MKRAISTVVGTLFVLSGSFLLVSGVTLLAVFGLDGRSQADAVRAVTPSSALVMDPQRADAGLPSGLELTSFSIKVTALDRGPTFVGVGPADDVLAYLSGTPYDIVRGVDGRSHQIDQRGVDGVGTPAIPGSQSFWTQQTAGSGVQELVVTLGRPDQLIVVMRPDGSGPVNVRIVAAVEAAWIGPAGLASTAAGTALLLIGLWLLLARGRAQQSEHIDPPQGQGDSAVVAPAPEPSEWGRPVASSDAPTAAGASSTAAEASARAPSSDSDGGSGRTLDLTEGAVIPLPRHEATVRSPAHASRVSVGGSAPEGPPREPIR